MVRATSSGARLPRSFFRRDPVSVGRGLLGQRLVSRVGGRRAGGTIVETEAYLGIPDKAAHTYGGRRTARNRVMWGDGGHAYVYLVYGMHHCLNVVAGRAGEPVAVLLRALQPEEGLEVMFERRQGARSETELCSGPGKLCQALGITRRHDGEDLVAGRVLFIETGQCPPAERIGAAPRIGVEYAEEWRCEPLRFFIRGSRYLSRPAPASPAPAGSP